MIKKSYEDAKLLRKIGLNLRLIDNPQSYNNFSGLSFLN